MSETAVRFVLHGEGTRSHQRISERGSEHALESDSVPAFGGEDGAASPISHALAALTGCTQVTGQVVAKELGLDVRSWGFDLKVDWDAAVLAGGSTEANPNFEKGVLDVTVDVDADDAQLERLRSETERRCPIFQLFARSGVALSGEWSRASAAAPA